MDLISDLTEKLGDWLPCLGLIFVVKICLGCLVNIYAGWRSYVLPHLVGLFRTDDFVERFGEWAVVTGCTGGIGREYAMGLAKKGMNMVLVSRSKQKLEEMEKKIAKLYNVKTMVIVADFTKLEALDHIVGKLKDSRLDIGILVNNVGILGPHYQPFLKLDSKTAKDMITVNITAATVLCHELLPAMVKKRKGAVINIASFASYAIGPYISEYSASKHYLHALTEAIAIELEDTGVIIQEVDPGQVATEMTKDFAPAPGKPPAAVYVASALDTLGYSQRTLGYWVHGLMWLIMELTPTCINNKMMKFTGKANYEYALEKNRKSS